MVVAGVVEVEEEEKVLEDVSLRASGSLHEPLEREAQKVRHTKSGGSRRNAWPV